MQYLTGVVAPVKTNRAEPSIKALAVEPLFDGTQYFIPDSMLNNCAHGVYPVSQ
jgi:hypothetical protein